MDSSLTTQKQTLRTVRESHTGKRRCVFSVFHQELGVTDKCSKTTPGFSAAVSEALLPQQHCQQPFKSSVAITEPGRHLSTATAQSA